MPELLDLSPAEDNRRMLTRPVAKVVACVLLMMALLAAKDFAPPPAKPAATYPAHETHSNEHVTVAIDPYDTPQKLEGAKVKYLEHGILPVRLIVTNEGDTPISLTQFGVQLITASKDKVDPASVNDVIRRIAPSVKRPDEPRKNPFPLPKIGSAPPQRIKSDQSDEIESMFFRAKAVEPHGTQAGFLFFDMNGLDAGAAGARLYVEGLSNANGQELMYFEVPVK
ncbi:MAG TPA: hypothetical protein VGC88_06930 [Terriglobales bacterium]